MTRLNSKVRSERALALGLGKKSPTAKSAEQSAEVDTCYRPIADT